MAQQKHADELPLSSAMLHTLLVLAGGEQHGYGIMQEIEILTEGQLRVGPGTLYRSLKRMLGAGLIEETDERPDPSLDDERRRYYRLTETGRRVLNAELARLEHLLDVGRRRLPGLGGT